MKEDSCLFIKNPEKTSTFYMRVSFEVLEGGSLILAG